MSSLFVNKLLIFKWETVNGIYCRPAQSLYRNYAEQLTKEYINNKNNIKEFENERYSPQTIFHRVESEQNL